ncbi:SDR family oxidoreductase [Streptomyces aidingensis]|uniref:Short-chain dehydrogenase n=1 Tax=Streptomyces aidingensis TaxID=910347 RepID=A0A1I1FD69_9ACTN|nr:SDR family oxidoreductase [Streptomyces aidingensis]SFB95658.1 Short-chain dehydrogenase [Streptomyces aidingensis]
MVEKKHGAARRVVVVTGASAGVGRAAVRAFAARGDAVALLARGERGLTAAAEEVRAAGGRALPLAVDVSDPEAVERAAERIEVELGPIEVWVNAAFSTVFAPVRDIRPEEFRRTTEVTYLGFVHGTQAALRRMLPRDRGTIVQVGSALAYRGVPLQAAYCAAKHAIQGFHESLRCELLHDGSRVRTTMVQLPGLNTPQFDWVLSRLPRHPRPVPPVYQPETAARAIVHAAEHGRRREHWVGMSTALTLLANKIAPGLLDRYLGRTGYASQQTGQPTAPDRPSNLWEPLDGPGGQDRGAHGGFDEEAQHAGGQLWASQHHGLLAMAGAAAAGGAVLGAAAARRARN